MRDVQRSFEHFGRVRALTAELLDETEAREHGLRARCMLLHASWRVGLSREELERLAVEARQIAARQGDARSRLDAEASLLPAYWLTGQLAKAAEIGESARRLADELGDVALRADVRGDLGHAYISSGRLDDALRLFDEALEIGGDDPALERAGFSTQVWVRSRRGWVRIEMGVLAPGVADLEVALRRARELRQWEIASWTLTFQAFADEYAGNPANALRRARESLEHAERAGNLFAQATAYHALGCAHRAAGEPRAALDALDRAQALPLSKDLEPLKFARMAEAQLALGNGESARSAVERAIRLAQEAGTRAWEARAYLTRARIMRALEGAPACDAIEACLARAETLIAETGARAQTPFVIEERARLAMVLGDVLSSSRLLQEARHAFEAMGHPDMPRDWRASSPSAEPTQPGELLARPR
jgi:tetratricopeptide (TPR) repeat protein